MTSPTLLVVEDGREYTEAFERLAAAQGRRMGIVRAPRLGSASAALEEGGIAGVFLDVVFDRIPAEDLIGPFDALLVRFGGDRGRAVRHLAENQGFYILDALAARLGSLPVVIAWDFSLEPARLAALRARVPGLEGLADGASLGEALSAFLARL